MLQVWDQSMEWFHVQGIEGESRVGSHVNSYSIDILVVPWVPKDLVCLAYDFMSAVGQMQGLQELFSHIYFLDLFGAAQKTAKPAGSHSNMTVGTILDPTMHPA